MVLHHLMEKKFKDFGNYLEMSNRKQKLAA
jgi:hypothetical protein